jgi:hypothetical protein
MIDVVTKGWQDSAEGILEWLDHHQSILESSQQGSKTPTPLPKDQLNIAFSPVDDHDVRCTVNEGAAHQVALDDNFLFHVYKDTPVEMIDHMLTVSRQSERKFMENEECDWKGEHCKENHLMRNCPMYKALDNRGKLDHIMKVGRCFNCYRKGHRSSGCPSKLRCREKDCGAKHNTALHEAWMPRTNAVSLLTKTLSPILLLTSPVMVATESSYLKKETNLIHNNSATLSVMSKEIADTIGLTGKTRLLGMSTIGTPNLVQQAFKATVNLQDSEGNIIGKVRVNVVPDFVDIRAVDWSTQAAKFPHLASINFPKPFIKGKCHILLGNDNRHMSAPTMNIIKAMEEPQSYPYAVLTPL